MRRLFAELEVTLSRNRARAYREQDDFETAYSMQKQLGGRTDTLKQALIDQKEGQLEQLKENIPDLTDTDVQMIQKIQDVHLERLWSNFLATGTPLPPAPLAEDPTLASMLRQLGSGSSAQSKGDKEELMAQFAQQLEAERRKSLAMMVRAAASFYSCAGIFSRIRHLSFLLADRLSIRNPFLFFCSMMIADGRFPHSY